MSDTKCLTALFVGLGSIGTRHLGHLRALCEERGTPLEVTALRATEKPLPPETAALVDEEIFAPDGELPLGAHFDLAFITGPTHLHAQAIQRLKGRADAFFIEKPIFERPGYDLDALGLGGGQKAYVAAPMRHTLLYAALRRALAQHLPYSVRVICSSYLPGWRPAADYRTVYSARREMGGGVALDLIHEWDYLVGLFGFPQQLCAMRGKFSDLAIDSDDLAVYIARYPGFLCEVHLDYFGRQYRREATFFCEGGTLQADWATGRLTLPDGTVQNHSEPPYSGHRRELAYFLDYAAGGGAGEKESLVGENEAPNKNSPAHAQKLLELVLGENTCQSE